MKRFSCLSASALLVAVQSGVAIGGANALEQTETMHRFEDQSVVKAAEARLERMEEGVYVVAETGELDAGHAVTMWWVVFNEPNLCSDGECGENDVFNMDEGGEFILNADGSAPMNKEAIETVGISALRADGRVIGDEGKAVFKGYLPVDDVNDAAFGLGLKDPMQAEIHLVLRDHQVPEPAELSEALNYIHGACDADWPNEPCEDVQFAVFPPADSPM